MCDSMHALSVLGILTGAALRNLQAGVQPPLAPQWPLLAWCSLARTPLANVAQVRRDWPLPPPRWVLVVQAEFRAREVRAHTDHTNDAGRLHLLRNGRRRDVLCRIRADERHPALALLCRHRRCACPLLPNPLHLRRSSLRAAGGSPPYSTTSPCYHVPPLCLCTLLRLQSCSAGSVSWRGARCE